MASGIRGNRCDGYVVRPALAGDRDAVAGVLAEAFHDDPHTAGLVPDSGKAHRMQRVFSAAFDETMAAGTHAYVAVGPDGTVGGTALWLAPGAKVPVLRTVRSNLVYLGVFGRRILDAARTDREMALHRPAGAHWYLHCIGTSSRARGRGLARLLLEDRLAVADRDGVGAYLESSAPANVSLYERFGFEVRGEIPAHGTDPAIAMWRTPR